MTQESSGGEESLAPVIPLFGARAPQPAPHSAARIRPDEVADLVRRTAAAVAAESATLGEGERAGLDLEEDEVAEDLMADDDWHTTWRDRGSGGPRGAASAATRGRGGVRFVEAAEEDAPQEDEEQSEQELIEAAEASLTKALRRRSLSESEAHGRLLREEVPRAAADEIVERFVNLGYIDDTALAEQIVHTGTTRKNQGRRAIAQALHARGISREVVEIALESLPDDDEIRALEYARGKANSLLRVDDETALRRLTGQLARRGFGGSLAMSAAKQALAEARRPSSGVRFQ
jgi:regulatory protein